MKKGRRASIHVCTCETCQHHPYGAVAKEHRAINRVLATLNERNRRRFVGLLAIQGNQGTIQRLMDITGLSRNTIRRGQAELQHPRRAPRRGRIRQAGGGRKKVEKKSAGLEGAG